MCSICAFSAIALQFDKMTYNVVEGESVEVCIMLIGESEPNVEITLSTLPNSAGDYCFD